MGLVRKLMPFIIILGTITVTVFLGFGLNNQLFKEVTIGGVTQYRLDLNLYMQNVSNSFERYALDFDSILPTREWDNTYSGAEEWWEAFVNNIALLFDYIYFPINVVIYPIRWFAWTYRMLLALCGWPMTMTNGEYDSSLIYTLSWISQNLHIPYI